MAANHEPSLWRNPSFWLLAAMLVFSILLHYSPHTAILSALSPEVPFGLTRHTMYRILFLLPVAYGGFMFGVRGGLITLGIAFVAMLPRVVLISTEPNEAIMEVASVVFVGGLVVLFFESQQRERQRRLQALSELRVAQEQLKQHIQAIEKNQHRLATLNAVSSLVSQSLELQQVLKVAVDKVMEVMDVEATLVFLVDEPAQELVLEVSRGVSGEFTDEVRRMRLGEGFNGRVALSGEPLAVADASLDPRLTREVVRREGLRSQLIVPLKAKGKVVGTLCVAKHQYRAFPSDEVDLLSAIANQIGISIENARLYENERRVAEQLRVSEKTYRDLFENASDAIWVHDMEGTILAANPATAKLLGYSREELLGRKAREFLSEQNLAIAREVRQKFLSGAELGQPYEQRLIKKDGSQVIIKTATSLITSDGLPRGFQHVARDVTDEERIKENLRLYAQQVTRAQEEERKRIARELHDDTAQALVAQSRLLEKLSLSEEHLSAQGLRLLDELRQRTDAILQGVRRFSQDLRPSILDDLGLLPSLESLAEDMTRQGIATTMSVDGEKRRLSPEAELVLFRIAQEALRNVWRHSGASQAELTIKFNESHLTMVIADNGRGFELPPRVGDLASLGKLGLAGMQERAGLIGGTLSIQSQPGAGTSITVEMPLS